MSLSKAWSPARLRDLGGRLWLAYAPFLALMVVYYGTATIVLGEVDAQISMDLVQAVYNAKLMAFSLVIFGCMLGYLALLKKTDFRLFASLVSWFSRTPFLEIVFVRFLPVVLLIVPYQQTYLAVKRHIPDLVPFAWDGTFAALDRLIFLGADPWTLTHRLIPWPGATWAMGVAYLFWFYLLMGSIAAAAVLRLESRLRMTFLLACLLSWSIGGSLLAVVFSSAGPPYVERLYGDPGFAPLMQRLVEQNEILPLTSVMAQERLWQGYADPAAPAMGISAFPSMHLCIAAGIMLFGFRLGRSIGCLLAAFTGVMLVASVHLGWHYAVDGIAGIGLAFVFWHVAKRFTDWWFDRASRSVIPRLAPVG